jgi:hypothetical protein
MTEYNICHGLTDGQNITRHKNILLCIFENNEGKKKTMLQFDYKESQN